MRLLGLILLVAGIVLQPLGWMFFERYSVISIALICAGVFCIYMARYFKEEEEEGLPAGGRLGNGTEGMGDIHGYSGQQSGGRSAAWESGHTDHSDTSSGDSGD